MHDVESGMDMGGGRRLRMPHEHMRNLVRITQQ